MTCRLAALVMLGCNFSLAFAQGPQAAFEAANQLYEQGRYREAILAYSNLVATGAVSAPILFNMGNACFKAGQLGRAIVAYRRAQLLAPRDPDIRANLQFARKAVTGQEELPAPDWRDWLGRLALDEWAILSALTLWGWLGALTVLQFRPDWRRFLGNPAAACLGLFLAASFCLGLRLYDLTSAQTAVVIAGPVQARMGPLDDSKSAFTCGDGTELAVVGTKNEWVEVRDKAQRPGWLKKEVLELLPGQP